MEQHPVPQQISAYQFRLVGDMTLKQFFQLAGGALIALLIYASGLPGLIKWPLIIFFGLFGAALAFLPYQERPLGHWLLAFFRSVYSPTQYFWQKPQQPPVFFQQEAATATGVPEKPPDTPMAKIAALLPKTKSSANLEEAEESFLSKIGQLFAPLPSASQPAKEPEVKPPPEKQKLKVPEPAPTDMSKMEFRPKVVVEKKPDQATVDKPPATTPVEQTLASQGLTAAQKAQFSLDAAPPHPPTIPNTVTGQVMSPEGKIVEGAILEIKDENGRAVRALKSNKAGHFLIVTSLLDGKYELATEKAGFGFEPVFFEAKGKIIPPIAIRAKSEERTTNATA